MKFFCYFFLLENSTGNDIKETEKYYTNIVLISLWCYKVKKKKNSKQNE